MTSYRFRPALDFLASAPKWLFLIALVYAPWAYGCTEPWSIDILDLLMNAIVFLWLTSLLFQKRLPVLHPVLAMCVIFLSAQGWLMTLNAHYAFIPDSHAFRTIDSWWPSGPGSVDKATSLALMNRMSGLLAMLCFASDLARNPAWRLRLLTTIGLAGASVILLGLVQRNTAAPMIFWEANRQGSQFFATYYYHGNAASFINLVLPAIAGMLWRSIRMREAFVGRAFWSAALMLCIAGALVNVSRAGMIVAGVLVLILLWWRSKYLVQKILLQTQKTVILEGLIVLVALFCIVTSVGWHGAADRWSEFAGQIERNNSRWLAWSACWRMLPAAGVWGFGPGTFEITFPHFTGFLGNAIAGVWRYAHEDYLQTAIEWGWFGAGAWGLLFIGGTIRGYYVYVRNSGKMGADGRMVLFTSATALVGILLHATVDFPFQIASLQLYAMTYTALVWGSE